MSIVARYTSMSLISRIVIGLIVGAILGLIMPKFGIISILGNLFVGALKAIAPVLVFVLVLNSLANAQMEVGKRFRKVIILYLISMFIAAFLAFITSLMFPVKINLDLTGATNTPPNGLVEVLSNLAQSIVVNPVTALGHANYVGILFWAIVFGFSLKKLAKPETLRVMKDIEDMVAMAVRFVIELAPFGILGLVFSSVAESGLAIFTEYGKLVLLLVVVMLFVALVVNAVIVWYMLKINPYPLIAKCIRESGVTAFFTRSSAANIPVNMSLCERMGLDRQFYSVSIPLGATINMNGAAITITIMTMAVAATLGINVDLGSGLMLCILASLGACGTSGVAGGSLLLIPMACSFFGIGNDIAMQAVAVGFIIGVVQDSFETALNSSGDVLFTATAEFHDRIKHGEKITF